MSLVTRPGGAEQHNTTTAEIARNADQATQGMTLNIGSMSRAAADTGHSSKDVLRAGVELTRQGEAPQPHDVI